MPSIERIKFVVGSAYQQIADLQPLPVYPASIGVTLSVNIGSTAAVPVNVASVGVGAVPINVASITMATSVIYGTFLNVGTGAGLLRNTSFLTRAGVQVKALNANTGNIFISTDSNMTATGSAAGFELGGGDGVLIPIDNLNKIHIAANVTSQNLAWMAA